MPPNRPSLALLLTLACSVAGGAAEPPTGEGWRLFETENFSLVSELGEGETRQIAVDLERLRSVLEELFTEASFESPVPNLLYVFADRQSFEPFSLGGDEPGFYAPHIHASFAAVVGEGATEALPIVYRQYLHELARHNIPQVPLWFRVGLAEIFGTFTTVGGTAIVGLPIERSAALAGEELTPLSALLDGSEPATRAFVEASWGLTHYLLVEGGERLEATRRLIDEFEADPTTRTTIAGALGVSIDELQEAVEAYLAREPLPTRVVAAPETPVAVAVTPLGRAEALTHLGDLRVHTAPEDIALSDALFRTAAELEPGYGPAIAGLGYLRELSGDMAGARELYSEARALYPDGFRIQFYAGESELALLGGRRPRNPVEQVRLESAVAAFQKVVGLRPQYGEGWARLGFALNLRPEPSPEAIEALERAYRMLAGRSDVAYNLLLAYARSGRREEAVGLVRALPARGADAETIRRAREVVHQLELARGTELARGKRYDDATGVLGRVVAETGDDAVRAQAEKTLAAIAPAATANEFVRRYGEAWSAKTDGDVKSARRLLDSLAEDAAGEVQGAVVAELLERLEP